MNEYAHTYIHTLLGSPEICVDMNSESSFKSLQDFPFDRHIISLKHCDFVWRTEKDDDDFFRFNANRCLDGRCGEYGF